MKSQPLRLKQSIPLIAIGALLGLCAYHQAQAAEKHPSRAKGKKEGLTIESGAIEEVETVKLATELERLKNQSRELRSQVLAIQDRLAAKIRDVCQLEIDFVTQNSSKKGVAPLAVMELQAALNEVEIVHYLNPPQLDRDLHLPLFLGPIPAGTYKLRVKGILGVLQHDWPYSLAQGRWNVDKTFTINLGDSNIRQVATITVRPGDLEPTLSMNERTETK